MTGPNHKANSVGICSASDSRIGTSRVSATFFRRKATMESTHSSGETKTPGKGGDGAIGLRLGLGEVEADARVPGGGEQCFGGFEVAEDGVGLLEVVQLG